MHESTLAQSSSLCYQERGMATIGIGLLLLFLLSAVTVFAARFAVTEQRIASNQHRADEAFEAAEAGLEHGIARLRADNTWLGAQYSNPLAGGASFTVSGVTAVTPAGHTVVNLVSTGTTADGTGTATARQIAAFDPLLANPPDAPLIAAGTLGGSGTIDIVTSANGGGDGVFISAWMGGDAVLSGSAKTCHLDDFLGSQSGYPEVELDPNASSFHTVVSDSYANTMISCPACSCPSDKPISNGANEGQDILDNDPNFPSDLFRYVFGVPNTAWQDVYDEATVLANCDSLDTSASGLYWINGDCDIQQSVGSFDKPVILVVDGSITSNAKALIFGILFAWAQDPSSSPVGREVKLNGGPTLYGSIMSNFNVDLGNGNYVIHYERQVLINLQRNRDAQVVARVPGGWSDF